MDLDVTKGGATNHWTNKWLPNIERKKATRMKKKQPSLSNSIVIFAVTHRKTIAMHKHRKFVYRSVQSASTKPTVLAMIPKIRVLPTQIWCCLLQKTRHWCHINLFQSNTHTIEVTKLDSCNYNVCLVLHRIWSKRFTNSISTLTKTNGMVTYTFCIDKIDNIDTHHFSTSA